MKAKGCLIPVAITAALALLTLCGCNRGEEYIIQNKFVDFKHPGFATYYYRVGPVGQSTMDSANKFNVGDDIRKYSKK